MQCQEMRHKRVKFIVELYKDLKTIQLEVVVNEELRMMVNNLRKFMQNKSDFETNQEILRMKWLFQGVIISN